MDPLSWDLKRKPRRINWKSGHKMDTDNEKKYDNKYLLERQLEMIKIFYERKLLTKEQYEFEVQTLTTRIKTDDKKES